MSIGIIISQQIYCSGIICLNPLHHFLNCSSSVFPMLIPPCFTKRTIPHIPTEGVHASQLQNLVKCSVAKYAAGPSFAIAKSYTGTDVIVAGGSESHAINSVDAALVGSKWDILPSLRKHCSQPWDSHNHSLAQRALNYQSIDITMHTHST